MSAFPTRSCDVCGRHAPCMNVTFFQNVGVLIVRFSQTLSGALCKPCVNEAFFRMSAISLFFGWWGIISFFFTLFTLPLNVVTWLRSLSLPAPGALPAGAGPGGAPSGAFGAAPAASGFGEAASSPPSKAVPFMTTAVGCAGIATAGFFGLIGLGMIFAPSTPDDPQSGLVCLVSSAVCCGAPGLLGAGYGLFRLFWEPKTG